MQKRLFRILTWLGTLATVLGAGWLLYELILLYSLPGFLVGLCFLYALFGFYRWFRDVEIQNAVTNNGDVLKFSNGVHDNMASGGKSSAEGASVTQGSNNSQYPNDPWRWVRDRLDHLEESKSDEKVAKSETRRVLDKIIAVEGEIDDVKAKLMMAPSHTCLRGEEISTMKQAIETSNSMAKTAQETANLTSARGFKIIMGFIAGLITLGSAAVVWAVNVGRTAEDAYTKIESVEKKVDVLEKTPQGMILDRQSIDAFGKSPRGHVSAMPDPASTSQVSVDALLDEAVTRAINAALERAAKTGQINPPNPPVANPDVFMP